ncbi:BnaC02g33600D [Brassica napus]|uniref:BnaC02g33600D protein n=1 Tax=Brassica napus TaxID=3708 RepID=A0A078HHI9_BRANA|nr:BnaC02g33600D [Brassica napus]
MKSNGKTIVSHDPIVKKPNGKDDVYSTVLDQPTGDARRLLRCTDLTKRFRLIHFWEARNVLTKTLIGLEMLLIDEHGTQGLIPTCHT